MGILPESDGIRACILAELSQNVTQFNRFWEKLESQRTKTLDQNMEPAFLEATIPTWEKTAFIKYMGSLHKAFTPLKVQFISAIYTYLGSLATLKLDIQSANEQIKKVQRQQMNAVENGVFNSSSEPVWNADIARSRQKSGEGWIDLVTGKRNVDGYPRWLEESAEDEE